MDIYRSVGVATIAALMGPEREPADPIPNIITRPCERAVITAYRELRANGETDAPALQACATLYRMHHPEAAILEARVIVASWIDHHILRGATGPTPGCDCD